MKQTFIIFLKIDFLTSKQYNYYFIIMSSNKYMPHPPVTEYKQPSVIHTVTNSSTDKPSKILSFFKNIFSNKPSIETIKAIEENKSKTSVISPDITLGSCLPDDTFFTCDKCIDKKKIFTYEHYYCKRNHVKTVLINNLIVNNQFNKFINTISIKIINDEYFSSLQYRDTHDAKGLFKYAIYHIYFGIAYEFGFGVSKDYKTALKYYSLEPLAVHEIAMIYKTNNNIKAALHWLKIGVLCCYPNSLYEYGKYLITQNNISEAIKHYLAGCEQKHIGCCIALADLYCKYDTYDKTTFNIMVNNLRSTPGTVYDENIIFNTPSYKALYLYLLTIDIVNIYYADINNHKPRPKYDNYLYDNIIVLLNTFLHVTIDDIRINIVNTIIYYSMLYIIFSRNANQYFTNETIIKKISEYLLSMSTAERSYIRSHYYNNMEFLDLTKPSYAFISTMANQKFIFKKIPTFV